MTESSASSPCPNCGEPASGRFCSSCGSPLGSMACGACGAELAPGAKFCHGCGTPVAQPGDAAAATAAAPAAPRSSGSSDAILWSVIAIALLALVAMVAGQRFARSGQNADAGTVAADAGAPSPMGAAPDISQMTPDERAQRLYDMIMGAYERGKTDTVQMFVPMGMGAFQMLDSLTLDQRYDLGRLGEVSGNPELAAAEADTILKRHPNHLLGLILAAQAAHSSKNTAAERRYLDRLLKAAPAEQAKQLPEYQSHENDITAALEQARKH
ncbi:MAG TPA: zinc-ribbon domain-containing protein [Gemmatimonadaceae bacterium]|nr:zinc-ribbon domain-containing protein [Gemmatimonadaceae bacterium]